MILPTLPDLAPMTWAIGFLEAPLDPVVRELVEWRERLGRVPRTENLSGGLPEALARFPPLDNRRELVMETANPQWVAYFHNGGSPHSTTEVLAEKLGIRGVVVLSEPSSISADRRTGSWGGTRFDLFGPGGAHGHLRSIGAVNDGGRWVWNTWGDPLPFEEVGTYTSKRVRDRLSVDMVERYSLALGIRLNDPSFYGPRGILLEGTALPPNPYAKSLAEARKQLRLDQPARQRGRSRRPSQTNSEAERFVEEWRGEGEDIRALAAEFRRTFDRLSGAGVVIDSLILNYEDGHGTWEIVATITMSQAEAIGYDHEKRLWLESQKVYD